MFLSICVRTQSLFFYVFPKKCHLNFVFSYKSDIFLLWVLSCCQESVRNSFFLADAITKDDFIAIFFMFVPFII